MKALLEIGHVLDHCLVQALIFGNALAQDMLYPTYNLILWPNTPYFLLKLSKRTTCGHQICCFPQNIEIFHSGQGIFKKCNLFMKVANFFLKETHLYLDKNKFASFCQFFFTK